MEIAMKSIVSGLAAVLLNVSLFWAGAAAGAVVTWDYTARVTSQIGTSHAIGDVISGWVSFDNSILDVNADPFAGQYPGSVQAWQHAEFQSTTYAPATFNTGFVYNDLPMSGPFLDRMFLATGWSGGGFFVLDVEDAPGAPSSLFASDALPTSPPDLSLATIAVVNVAAASSGPYLYTDLLTLTLRDGASSDVPVPGGLTLLSVGLAGIVLVRRRNRAAGRS